MYKKENVPLLPRDLSPETTLVNFFIYIYFTMDVYMKYLFFPLSNIDISDTAIALRLLMATCKRKPSSVELELNKRNVLANCSSQTS